MQIPDPSYDGSDTTRSLGLSGRLSRLCSLLTLLLVVGGCSKDSGMESVESDANGYYCRSCKAKMFTERKVFLENCPKCQENALADVIGYWCEKDKHLTIRPKIAGPEGANVCEKCNQPLKNAMVSPREKNLVAWGATETQPK
jgi:hypothetical protein